MYASEMHSYPASGVPDIVPDVEEKQAKSLVVLVSGTGLLLQALLDAAADPAYGASIVAVGADREPIPALERARTSGVDTFVRRIADFTHREDWDDALTATVASYEPDLVISAGFLKLVGPAFLRRFEGRFLNTHPSLLPAFPGIHAPRDALEHGVRITGTTAFFVDDGVDTGPIVEQHAVPVMPDDDVETLHARIKETEQRMIVDLVRQLSQHGWTIHGRKVTIP